MHIHTIQLNIEKLIGGTAHMDATEFGAYMSLIVAAYQCNNKLPEDDKRLARMARVTGHKWAKIKGVVLEKFELKNGTYEQKFVKKDLQRMESLSKKNKANRLKNKDIDKPVVNQNVTNTSNKDQRPIVNNKGPNLNDLSVSHIQDWLGTKRVAGVYTNIDEHRLLEMFKDYCTSKGKTYKDYVAGFRNSFEWNNAPKKGTDHANNRKSSKYTGKSNQAKDAIMRGID